MTVKRNVIVAVLLSGVLAVGLAACASRATGVMQPISAQVDPANVVPLLVATTRMATPDTSQMFTGQRGLNVAYADVGISVPPVHKAGDVEWPSSYPGDPKQHFVTTRAKKIDRKGFLDTLHATMKRRGTGQVLVFVHGYNNTFEDSVYRFAQIAYDSGSNSVPILFTWPSRGKLLAYAYDRESAVYSRDGLETLLQDLARDPAVKDIAILAHSMGNAATLEALRQMAVRNGSIAPKIRNVMLASPDVDLDVARALVRGFGPKPPHITLFTSQDDIALKFSSTVWGSTNRLGAINATVEPYASALAKEKIDVFDLTALKAGDSLHHSKFAESPEVVKLIGARLASGQSIDTRHAGLGDHLGLIVAGTTSTVGNAATFVLSAPIAVVDPKTRENLGERLQSIAPIGTDENALPVDHSDPDQGQKYKKK